MIELQVLVGPHALGGQLIMPARARGLVLVAHVGSSRRGARHHVVTEALHGRHLATLLFDLLSESETREGTHGLDIALLAQRLLQAMSWVRQRPDVNGLRLGLFGAGTAAAAAIVAAAERPLDVAAVVCSGGRPDLAGPALPQVRAPTQLLVGAMDADVL